MKSNYLVQAWLVLGLAVCFGAGLAGVEASLADKIATNKLNETIGQIPLLVPGSTGAESQIVDGRIVYRAINPDGELSGWSLTGRGQGFSDQNEVLIGLDAPCQTITGLYVLAQKETPGLGNKIIERPWLEQFSGKDTLGTLAATKAQTSEENEVKTITGATISSESVTKIVNDTIAALRGKLIAAEN